jgi:CHAT domain-containing protein
VTASLQLPQAGAQSIVASLWVVDDNSQSILMQEFYNQLINNRQSKGQALRQAQLKLLRSDRYSSPYYWANMVLLGSWL